MRRKDILSSEGRRRGKYSSTAGWGEGERKSCAFNLSAVEGDALPIISEVGFACRPISEYKSQRSGAVRRHERDDSFFDNSSHSLHDSKIFSPELEQEIRTIASREGSKRVRLRVFGSDKDEQLLRERLVAQLGIPVLWKATEQQLVLEYPKGRSLWEKCCRVVEERQGEEPLLLVYPSEYYHLLFANNCEELTDIVRCLAATIVRGQGALANNQVSLQNVRKVAEKEFLLEDWGCAGYQQTLRVQSRVLTRRTLPRCREGREWLLLPEYLSPELLRAIELESFEHLWAQRGGIGACDVW
jgi:hypothetical protein